jgi:ferredoxin
VVDNFLRNADLAGNKRAYFILTCGEKAGDAVRSIKTLCIKKGLEFMGLASVVMPENYVAMFPVPGKEKADEVLQKATPHIFSLAKEIKAGRALRENKPGLVDTFQSGAVNPIFYAFVVSAKKFHATDACTHCGRCAVLCALNNISLVDGKPRWGRKCTHCMACICGCPAKAIEYGTKTQGRPRYYNTGFRQ